MAMTPLRAVSAFGDKHLSQLTHDRAGAVSGRAGQPDRGAP